MTRILASVAILCAATSVGCSSMNSTVAKKQPAFGPNTQMAARQQASRQGVQQASHVQQAGLFGSPACGDGCGDACCPPSCGTGCCPPNCGPGCDPCAAPGCGCVDRILDCNGCGMGCGSACGPGGCGPIGGFGPCTCGGMGQCCVCQRIRACRARACAVGHAACDMACDPRACMTDANYNFNPGPPTGQVAYPYYTTKGPRDFFLDKPSSIGP